VAKMQMMKLTTAAISRIALRPRFMFPLPVDERSLAYASDV
jgi:hypothetical protein